MKTHCVIFDVDGTLINSSAGHVRSIREFFEEQTPIHPDLQTVTSVVKLPIGQILSTLLPESSDAERDRLKSIYLESYQMRHPLMADLYHDTRTTLVALSTFCYIGTATNLSTRRVYELLERFEIAEFIDHPRGTDASDAAKPAPDILNETIDRAGIALDKTVMVGDSLNDIRAGQHAGIKTAGVSYSGKPDVDFAPVQPDYYLTSISGLLPILNVL